MNKFWQNMQFRQIRQTLATPNFYRLQYTKIYKNVYLKKIYA